MTDASTNVAITPAATAALERAEIGMRRLEDWWTERQPQLHPAARVIAQHGRRMDFSGTAKNTPLVDSKSVWVTAHRATTGES